MTPTQERLLSQVTVTAEGCWLWTGHRTASGYGLIRLDGQRERVHRVSYEAFVGPIPEGLVTDHLCRTPLCINPSHLEPVTNQENLRRGLSSNQNRAKTHCPRGHAYTPENTYRWRSGFRECVICHRAKKRAQYHARKAVAS